MPNEQEDQILLIVDIDEGATEARIKALNAQIKFLRDTAKGLEKDLKDGLVSQQQYDNALAQITVQSKKLSGELTLQKKALDDSRKDIVANSGSLNEMRAKAQAAAAEYSALSEAERENEKVGGALLQRVHNLNQEYDEQNKKLTQGKKSIGDYIKDTTVLGINVGETIEKFKAGGTGVLTFAKGIFSARGALVALTSIPIILFLTALVSFLTKSQAGMDFLERKTAGLTAVLKALSNIVVGVGEKLFKAFESGQLGATLLDAVVTNLTNRFTGLRVIAEGVINLDWRKITDGFIQVGTGVKDATGKASALATELNKTRKAGEAIALASQKIRDAEIALNVERSKSRAEIEKLKKLSEDTTKSTEVRANAAQQAYNKENAILQKSIELQKRKIANVIAEKKQGQEGAEAQQAIAEEQIKLNELIEESTGKQTELQNNLNNLRLEGANNALAANKKAIDEQVAYYERALIQAKRNKEDTVEIEEAIIKLRAKSALVDTSVTDQKGEQARQLIIAQSEADILELRTNKAIETAARLNNIKQSEIKALLALVKEGTLAELELNKALIQEEADLQKQQTLATIKNKEEADAKIREIDSTTKKALLDADKAFYVKQVELAQKRAEDQQKISDTLLGRFNADQAKKLTSEQSHAQTLLQIAKKGSRDELNAKINDIEIQRKAEIAAANGNVDLINEINKRADDAIAKAKQEFIVGRIQAITDVAAQAANVLQNILTAQSQAAMNALDKQQTAALESAGANAELRGRIEEQYAKKRLILEKEFAEKQRKIASVQNLIATAQAVTKAFVEGGPIFGPILAAISLAAGLAQQSIIDSQTFAKGGVFKDSPSSTYISDGGGSFVTGPGSGKSDSINARISNGEAIINARSTHLFYDQLSALNVAGGGRPFPGAGDTPVPQVSGFNMGGVKIEPNSDVLVSAVIAGMKSAKLVVAVTDIHSVESDMTYAKATGNI